MFSLPASAVTPLLQDNLKSFALVCEVAMILHLLLIVIPAMHLTDGRNSMADGLLLSYLVASGLRIALHYRTTRKAAEKQ